MKKNKAIFISLLTFVMSLLFTCFVGCSQDTITLSDESLTLYIGDTYTLTATLSNDETPSWSSSDENVITVENGVVTAVGVGECTVTVQYNKVSAVCNITIRNLNQVCFKNGDTVLDTQQLKDYQAASFTKDEPDKDRDAEFEYYFEGWATSVDGQVVDLETYQVVGDTTFYAIFGSSRRSYKVTWNIEGVTSESLIKYGQDVSYDETPVKDNDEDYTYTFKGWALEENGEIIEVLPKVTDKGNLKMLFFGNLKMLFFNNLIKLTPTSTTSTIVKVPVPF